MCAVQSLNLARFWKEPGRNGDFWNASPSTRVATLSATLARDDILWDCFKQSFVIPSERVLFALVEGPAFRGQPPIDLLARARYSVSDMPVKSIQLGQVWRNDQTSQNFLVTKLYNEVFTQYAILRPADAGAASADTIRVKVQKSTEGATLPGYTFTQEAQEF